MASRQLDIKLRQITGIAKAPYVADFVDMLLQNGEEKIVLCGWHREVYDIWLTKLKQYNPVLYTGTESPEEKNRNKEKFINGNSRILILSLRSGSGLDGIQKVCNLIVFGELDWSPQVIDQNIGRVNRDELLESATAFFLISNDGIDPAMTEVLNLKRNQSEGIINLGEETTFSQIDIENSRIKEIAKKYLENLN